MGMHYTAVVLALGLAGSAQAAGVSYKLPTTLGHAAPVYMPSVSIVPLSLPTVHAELAAPILAPSLKAAALPAPAPISLPNLPAPAIGPARLPGVPSPLPLPERTTLAGAKSAPSVDLEFVLNWSLLDDGDEAAPVLVPNDPGPRPLSPAGAVNELKSLAHRDDIPAPGRLFDGVGKREKLRDLELPHVKYF